MDSPTPGKSRFDRRRLLADLVEGRTAAARLRCLLNEPLTEDDFPSAERLARQILRSFTCTLAALMNSARGIEVGAFGSAAQAHGAAAACSDDRMSQDSVETPAVKDRRGSYKRRKVLHSRINISATLHDGFAWRKYGQKNILNAKYPRCYFRCTHKNDKGCKAIKHVQKDEEDEKMYHITYFGNHTCGDHPSKAPDSPSQESCLLNFETTTLMMDFSAGAGGPQRDSAANAGEVAIDNPSESYPKKEVSDDNYINVVAASSCDAMWPPELIADLGSTAEAPHTMIVPPENDDVASGVLSGGVSTSFHDLDLDTILFKCGGDIGFTWE